MKIIVARGVGEHPRRSMLHNVTQDFPEAEVVNLPWSATFGPVGGAKDSHNFVTESKNGARMLREELDKGPAIVLGYSGGAEIAGIVASEGHENLIGTGLVAYPSSVMGVLPARRHSSPIFEISNPDDMISSVRVDSPWRLFALFAICFSLRSLMRSLWLMLLVTLSAAFWSQLVSVMNPIGAPSRLVGAYLDACGYMGRNKMKPWVPGRNTHTDYHLVELTEWVHDAWLEHATELISNTEKMTLAPRAIKKTFEFKPVKGPAINSSN